MYWQIIEIKKFYSKMGSQMKKKLKEDTLNMKIMKTLLILSN